MKLNSQLGKSFLEVFGVLFAVACVLIFGFSKYTQDKHHQNMQEIIEVMHLFFERYQAQAADIFKQTSIPSGASFMKNYSLLDECNEKASFFNKYKTVCSFSLGELDATSDVDIDTVQSYVYVNFLDMYKKYSCKEFLSVGWEKVLPKTMWTDKGYIGVISENTSGKMYFSHNSEYIRNDGAEENPTRQRLKTVCDTCKGSRYCTILFAFVFNDDTLKRVTFPAEFTGEQEEAKEGEKTEVSKDGKTYTKTSGGNKEVVTYSKNTFSGSTYRNGSLRSVYEGTYSSRGITSYTSYDATRRNMIQKIDNIKYDQKGNVQSYEKDSKKILLTGNADDCLIMDNDDKTRRFGHCADLFGEAKSTVLLQYDSKGFLKEAVFDGKDKKAYTFRYDYKTGELTDYCEADGGKCHKVSGGKMLKDIIKHNIPDTIQNFDSLYGQNIQTGASKDGNQKRRVLTKEEVLMRVKDRNNRVKVKMK